MKHDLKKYADKLHEKVARAEKLKRPVVVIGRDVAKLIVGQLQKA